ncbi:hypothetical protein PMAYCL1PPCAC_18350, partial [Pristionchus mayeri]
PSTHHSFMLLLLACLLSLAAAQNEACSSYGRDSGDSSCGQSGGQRFYFDTRTRLCQPFYYKGCNGNGNRFSSRPECISSCANATISSSSSSGHGGSSTRVLCPAGNVAANDRNGSLSCDRCPHGYECVNGVCCGTREFTCSLGYDAGRFPVSGSHVPMYFYNKDYKNCMLFTYYGSEGNPNTFPDYNQCKKFCT